MSTPGARCPAGAARPARARARRFYNREGPVLLLKALAELARFLGAPAAGLAFVPNVTTAINSVLRSIPLPAGAELLVTSHEYNATRNSSTSLRG